MGTQCPRCQFENRDEARFCLECGAELLLACPQCGRALPARAKFCDECGCDVAHLPRPVPEEKSPAIGPSVERPSDTIRPPITFLEGERKYVTVLFTDISGYTRISERLDPEELKEITSLIFSKITAVIGKYDGFIEKYVGDAIVALFGVQAAHEDDPVRAIRAAREIHELVEAISPRYEKKICLPLSMHTGINTGIAVTGEIDSQKGMHGVVGDTINLAARLSSLGTAGEILVGPETYSQSEGYFRFEEREPAPVKGLTKPVLAYRVLAPLEQPRKVHRLHGLRSRLVGRKVELALMKEAVDNLWNGKGAIFGISGPPGNGKSRLIEEFKASLNLKENQWREGHAYSYAQNIPYFPFINLLSRAFRIEEDDTPDRIREKIERGVQDLVGARALITPFLGSLYNLEYPELIGINPELWRNQLQKAIQSVFSALALKQPTIICFEDLHWADPSSLELLRLILLEAQFPVLFLCVYRPTITLFTIHQLNRIGKSFREIRLQDLSPSETQDMLESLLGTDAIPSTLRNLVEEKMEGNPFYLEEAINSLIDSEILVKTDGRWTLTRPVTDANISKTIQGVIAARLDRLDTLSRRVLQEASVIGRSFPHEILERITDQKKSLPGCLDELARLDLLRVKPQLQALEYDFKHAIIQEVVYNGLLKKERQEIHERIGGAIEDLFQRRLGEFSETLAYHYGRGKSRQKAVDYLIQSGRKSLKRYSVEESHQYFSEAYNLLTRDPGPGGLEQKTLIRLLNTWSPVFYFRGSFQEQVDLLKNHLDLAESLEDKDERGMFYVWLGMSLWGRSRFRESYNYLHSGLKLGEEIGSKRVIGYVGAWLPWTCTELGLFEEALVHAERAREMVDHFVADDYPYYHSLDAKAFVYFATGEPAKILELGDALLKLGQDQSSIRAITWAYYVQGWGHMAAGNFAEAIRSNERAVQSSADPFYTQFPKLSLGMSYVSNQEFDKARQPLQDVTDHDKKYGCEVLGTASRVFQGVIAMQAGHFAEGMAALEEAQKILLDNDGRWRYAITELILGEVFLNMTKRVKAPVRISMLTSDLRFLMKNIPFAGRKSEEHYHKAIDCARAIGAKGLEGQAYLGLGQLYGIKRKKSQAEECLSAAIRIFEKRQAGGYLEQAKTALARLKEKTSRK
jgi:class 3 adenylate cyclase/tetratricopeptide (TPR) repeat protein